MAVTLRIADHIASGRDRIEDISAAAECDARALRAMMEHLASRGVFEEPEPGRFALNDLARELLDPGVQIGLDLNGIGGRMAHAWSTLLTFVRTGVPAYDQVFGRPFWDDLNANPHVGASFDDLMGPDGHGTPDAEFAISGGWESVRTVVDVGGGTGAMLREILRLRPWIQGTLVDLASTAARAPRQERLTVIGQSFFDPLPGGADLYLLRKVLNDWPDREAEAILRRCAAAAGPSGRVLILRSTGQGTGLPIEMVLVGGKPRTQDEMCALAARSGLSVTSCEGDVIECRPIAEESGDRS